MSGPANHPQRGHVARRDERSATWFDGLHDGVLLIRRCPRCGHRARPDATACAACHQDGLEWVSSAGDGTVVCVIVDRAGDESLALGLVELDEGPWLHARLLPVAGVAAGDRVRFSVLHPDDGEPLPVFRSVD